MFHFEVTLLTSSFERVLCFKWQTIAFVLRTLICTIMKLSIQIDVYLLCNVRSYGHSHCHCASKIVLFNLSLTGCQRGFTFEIYLNFVYLNNFSSTTGSLKHSWNPVFNQFVSSKNRMRKMFPLNNQWQYSKIYRNISTKWIKLRLKCERMFCFGQLESRQSI